ncbi:MAG: class I SAM-dependent methyltransferase [Polyangiaceae bacterium]
MNANAGSVDTDDWNQHWSSYADSNALNPAQAYRRMLIFRALSLSRATSAQTRLLELGCGQGEFSAELKERHPGLELVGVDLSHTGVGIAQSRVPSGAFFQQDLLQPIAIPEEYRAWATHAVCSEVLEHLDDPLTALRNVRACLAPGARLVITVPAGPMSAFDQHIGHRRHFTPDRLRQLLQDAGLEVKSLHGAGFPFFNLYRLTVVARGKKLIEDAGGALPLSARAAIWAFTKLFRLNTIETLRGWQLVAVAAEPSGAAATQSVA